IPDRIVEADRPGNRNEVVRPAERVVADRSGHADVGNGRGELSFGRVVALNVTDDLPGASIGFRDHVDNAVAVVISTVRVDLDGVESKEHPVHAKLVENGRALVGLPALKLRPQVPVPAVEQVPIEPGSDGPRLERVSLLLEIVEVADAGAANLAELVDADRIEPFGFHRRTDLRR